MPFAQQWLQRGSNPPAIDARKIAAENCRIDVAGAPAISGEELAVKLLRRPVRLAHATSGNLQHTRTIARRDGPFEGAVTIALASFGAFMPRRSERRDELPFEHGLDGFAYLLSKLGFEVLAKLQNRRMVRALRATLLHGVPPSPLNHGDFA